MIYNSSSSSVEFEPLVGTEGQKRARNKLISRRSFSKSSMFEGEVLREIQRVFEKDYNSLMDKKILKVNFFLSDFLILYSKPWAP